MHSHLINCSIVVFWKKIFNHFLWNKFNVKIWIPLRAPVLAQGSRIKQLRTYNNLGRLHCNLTNSIVILVKKIFKAFPYSLDIFRLKFEPLLRPRISPGGHHFNRSKDAGIVISQIVASQFLRERFLNLFPIYFYVKRWTPLGAPLLVQGSF